MSSLSERLQRILEQPEGETASPLLPLLASMPPQDATLLRRCAIPHQFTAETLPVLDPQLSPERAAEKFERLQRLSVTVRTTHGIALHEDARKELFREWLAPERAAEFAAVSRRLYAYVDKQLAKATGDEREQLRRRAIFHQLAFERTAALATLEKTSDFYRRNLRYTAAETLLRVAREYDPVLEPHERDVLAFHEARLAAGRGDTKGAIAIFTRIASEPHASDAMKVRALYRLGRAHIDERQWTEADRELRRALKLVDHDSPERPAIFRWRGVIARELGNLDRAEDLLERSARVASERGDDFAAAAAWNALGSAFRESGELQRAIEMFERAGALLGDRQFDLARVHHNLGTTYMDLRDYAASEAAFKRSLEIKRAGGDTVGQAYTWRNLAQLYQQEGKGDAAIEAATQAVNLFEEALDWYNAGSAAMFLASLQVADDRDAAKESGERAIRDFEHERDAEAAAGARRDLEALLHPKRTMSPWTLIILVAALIAAGVIVYFLDLGQRLIPH